jgi:S-DNA-T family DNA segregation ATPase FtsK/SpoIIIE
VWCLGWVVTSAPQRTVTGPRPPELPPPHRFPLVATIAPLVVTVVLFAVTRSAFTLVFAALGPLVAVASTVDAALQRRRTLRRETARFESELVRSAAEITAAHDDERRDTLTIPSRELWAAAKISDSGFD